MAHSGDTKIIIVSNSHAMKTALQSTLATEPVIKSIGIADNILDAASLLDKYVHFIIILDTERQSLTQNYLRSLMEKYNVNIILLSSDITEDSKYIRVGIKDLIKKPRLEAGLPSFFCKDLKDRIKKFSINAPSLNVMDMNNTVDTNSTLITIASSTGGTEALLAVLKEFPKSMPPILIVQHMPPVFTGLFADRLNKLCNIHICEAKDGEYIKKNTAYIAPGDFHMRVIKSNSKLAIEVFTADKVNCVRPAADILFNSIASLSVKKVVGVILTGMGVDGAKGLLELRRKGARTVGQDDKTSVVYGMPKAAFNIGAVEYQEPIGNIANTIMKLI